MSKLNPIWLVMLILSFHNLYSQSTLTDSIPTELEEVVISATRTRRQLSSLPLPATLVSQKEIQGINAVRLAEVINEQTGLITVPDFGGGEGVQLQGLDSQYTLILIDGVPPIGRSAGTLDLSRIAVGNIKQLEIVKGASSSLYGSEALGGVINIITEKPKDGFKGEVSYRAGTFNNQDFNASINYKKDKLGLQVFVNRFSSDGFDLTPETVTNTVDPFSNYTFSLQSVYDISEKTKILLSGRIFTQDQENRLEQDLSGENKLNEWNALFKLDHDFNNKWSAYLELYTTQYQANETLRNDDGTPFSNSDFNQRFTRPELRVTYDLDENHSFISGLGLTNETLDRSDFFTRPEFNAPYLYMQYDGKPLEKLNLIIGFRYDDHNVYASQFSPKLALRYELFGGLALKGSMGYGFKAPDFRQLYFDFSNSTVGYTVLGYNAVAEVLPVLAQQGLLSAQSNNDLPNILSSFKDELKAENSVSYNIGIDFKTNSGLKLNLNLFRNDIRNLIDTQVIAQRSNGQNVFSYRNLNRVYTQGLELDARWSVNRRLTIAGGYQLLYARDKAAEMAFDKGEVFARETPNSPTVALNSADYFGLLNRSRHLANFKVFYEIPKWKLNTNLRTTYRSRFGLFDSNGNTFLDSYDDFVEGYAIIDLAVNKQLWNKLELGVGVDNLFDFTDVENLTNIAGSLYYAKINFNF